VKSIKFNFGGTVRLFFHQGSYWESPPEGAITVYSRIYKNGVAIGTERVDTTLAGNDYTEDFTVSAGDVFSVYSKVNQNTTNFGRLKNYRAKFTPQVGYNFSQLLLDREG
jgi:hypothetical protein